MLLDTYSMPFRNARSTNATDTAFPSRVPTGTEPTGDGVIDLVHGEQGCVRNRALIVAYGTDAADETFAMRVIGWRRLGNDPETLLWVPVTLTEITCTLGASTGVAGREVVATEFFADTMAFVAGKGAEGENLRLLSPADDTIAHVEVALQGFAKLEITFDMVLGASGNALVALF